MKEIVNLSASRARSRPHRHAFPGVGELQTEIVNKLAGPLVTVSRRSARPGQHCSMNAANAYERAQALLYGDIPPLFDFKI
jgi:hypothetical protein